MTGPTTEPLTPIELVYQEIREIAARELRIMGADAIGGGFSDVMKLIDALIEQKHPDINRMRLISSTFYQLIGGGILSPLTGLDDEWVQVTPTIWQNIRCPRVIKELGVGCYDSMAVVFIDEKDNMFTKQPQSRRAVAFPYEPETKYVRVNTAPKLLVPSHVKRH